MEFSGFIRDLGPVPVAIFLLCICGAAFFWLNHQMSDVSRSIAAMRDEQKRKDKEQDDKIDQIINHYVQKEDMFRQFGGWRTEINKVSEQQQRMSDTLTSQILHLTELLVKKNEEK